MKDQKLIAAENEPPTTEMAEKLVLETVAQVERLAELAAKFPEPFRQVARKMCAWPVMRFKREAMDDNFGHVLYVLQLAEDYPLDTGSAARSHPSSATGQYLTRWVERLHRFKFSREWPNDRGGSSAPEWKTLLDVALRMPPLTKDTSDKWCGEVLVPLIMLSDAGVGEASCKEPALRAIWRQSGVKSQATFRSRLLTKVRQTLRSLAPPVKAKPGLRE